MLRSRWMQGEWVMRVMATLVLGAWAMVVLVEGFRNDIADILSMVLGQFLCCGTASCRLCHKQITSVQFLRSVLLSLPLSLPASTCCTLFIAHAL